MDLGALELRVEVGVEPDAEAAELEEATARLRGELLELDVIDVRRPPGAPAPPGARAAEVTLLGTLVVSAAQDVLGAVVQAIAGWIGRGHQRSVRLEIAGDSIELTNSTVEEQRRLLEVFLARHGAEAG